jgi:hypothetical protein
MTEVVLRTITWGAGLWGIATVACALCWAIGQHVDPLDDFDLEDWVLCASAGALGAGCAAWLFVLYAAPVH